MEQFRVADALGCNSLRLRMPYYREIERRTVISEKVSSVCRSQRARPADRHLGPIFVFESSLEQVFQRELHDPRIGSRSNLTELITAKRRHGTSGPDAVWNIERLDADFHALLLFHREST